MTLHSRFSPRKETRRLFYTRAVGTMPISSSRPPCRSDDLTTKSVLAPMQYGCPKTIVPKACKGWSHSSMRQSDVRTNHIARILPLAAFLLATTYTKKERAAPRKHIDCGSIAEPLIVVRFNRPAVPLVETVAQPLNAFQRLVLLVLVSNQAPWAGSGRLLHLKNPPLHCRPPDHHNGRPRKRLRRILTIRRSRSSSSYFKMNYERTRSRENRLLPSLQ